MWACAVPIWAEPAVELGVADGVIEEVNFIARKEELIGLCGDGARGMQDELPLTLIPKETKCSPGQEERDGEDQGESFEDPARVD
jgi:hypothetical protein